MSHPDAAAPVELLYRELFATPLGAIVLNSILVRCGLLAVSQTPGDSHETAFQEGRRSVALELMQTMRWTEGRVFDLVTERATTERETTIEEIDQ